MGMIGSFFMTDRQTIDKIQNGEIGIADLLYGDEDLWESEVYLDIDKTWHMIYFMLESAVEKGFDPILSELIFSGNAVNDVDLGCGPAMLLTEEQVAELAVSLEKISRETLHQFFDLSQMRKAEIYPIIDEDNEDIFDYIWDNFSAIIPFFKTAAEKHYCVLSYIS